MVGQLVPAFRGAWKPVTPEQPPDAAVRRMLWAAICDGYWNRLIAGSHRRKSPALTSLPRGRCLAPAL
jgi:hypothetical protein